MESVASETNKKLNEEEEHDDEESPIEEHRDEDCPIEEHVEEESLIEEQVDEESPIEEHGDEEYPIEEHDDTESPVEEEYVDEESPIEEHVEEESPIEEHDDEESPIEEPDGEECPIEEHVNEESPIEEHDDKECPIEEHDDEECPIEEHVDEESPIEEHDDEESPIEEHDDTESPIEEEHVDEESRIEEHVEEVSPIEEHDDEESPIEEHDDEECPIEEHDDEESPIKEHDDTESPIEEEHVDEESPIEEHDDEESPIEEHDDEESTIEEHDDEECPIVEHVDEESPIEEHVDEESPMEEHVEEESPIEVHVDEESPIEEHDDEESPIEEVRSTVPTTDDSTQSVWTFRMWVLGLASCVLLACQNQFFSYQASPLIITQLATLALGRRMAALLPTSTFGFPGCGSRKFSLNPGPFNMKEHVLISIFANTGAAFGSGSAYAVGIVNIIKAFYGRNISFIAAWLLIITTQVLGYGWAGLLRKYVVEPSHMWWPGTLVQVSLFRKFEIDYNEYGKQGKVNLSTFFLLTYGFGFATIASTLTHVGLFYGKEIYQRYKASTKGKVDVHTRLMRNYKDIPSWWFYVLLTVTLMVSLALTLFMKDQIQMPFWGLILSAVLAFCFTLPISIITATTNQTPGLNIITEYAMGLIYPGKPIANVCFKTYGYMSMTQAIYFLSDFKLGHYMKIPPRSMFLVQVLGTIIAGTVNLGVAWYLLSNMDEICHPDPKSNSPWTCPVDTIFFDASVIWGLVGPKRIFGPLGNYGALNWFFLGGIMGPVAVWLCHKALPSVSWIPLINLPVLLGATAYMPLTGAVTYNSWILVGTIFNFFVFRYQKMWWKRYNYILSAALDAGVASMDILLYFTTGLEDKTVHWWGTDNPQHCDLATCPTAKGLNVTEHDDEESPIEENHGEECPIEEHVEEESLIEEHINEESPVKEHDDEESPIEEHKNMTIKEHEDEESPIEEHVDEESPVEEHDDEESPIEEHVYKESPIEEHDNDESPIEEHVDEECRIEEHVDEESPIEEHVDEESPIEEPDDEESPIEEVRSTVPTTDDSTQSI
nr:oligopeptide transporter 4-like [Tanacetum cinerariifolium]